MQIAILGAGSIGCYLGAVLHQEGLQVTLIGRERIRQQIQAAGGIHISDYLGNENLVEGIHFTDQQRFLADADLVFITLKCLAMEEAAQALQQHCRPGTRIICLQNGIGSDDIVRTLNPQLQVSRGIVGFNVVSKGNACFHRAMEGGIHLEHDPALLDIQDALEEQQISCFLEKDFDGVAWAKLQLNLNNAINALADIPLRQQIEQRNFRRVLSLAMKEAARVAAKQKIRLARMTPLPPVLLPSLIRTPDFIFRNAAKKMLAIDPQARSSMWEDIQNKRATEIHFLNGAISSQGQKLGVKTPVNDALVGLIKELESGQRKPGFGATELLQYVTR